jgi:HD-like signal output (HDOD) protein
MAKYQIEDFLKHVSELSTISPVAVELINKINLPNTTRKDVADLVAKDEILYANIFKFVNSAAFPSARRPQNLGQAIDLMGTNEVRNLVFAIAARKAFVDLELWFRSVFTAFAAQKFARAKEYPQDEVSNIYIVGLMQSLGEQIYTTFYKQENESVKEAKTFKDKLKLQKEIFGYTSLELSAEILKDFGLPDAIIELIDVQKLDTDDENFKEVNAIIYTAACLSELSEEKSTDEITPEELEEALDRDLIKRFQLNDISINLGVFDELQSDTRSFVNI